MESYAVPAMVHRILQPIKLLASTIIMSYNWQPIKQHSVSGNTCPVAATIDRQLILEIEHLELREIHVL